jgi:hypothetical protein
LRIQAVVADTRKVVWNVEALALLLLMMDQDVNQSNIRQTFDDFLIGFKILEDNEEDRTPYLSWCVGVIIYYKYLSAKLPNASTMFLLLRRLTM